MQPDGALTPAEFRAKFGVTDAVIARLSRYQALLGEWQARMNLVGPNTLAEVWSRHFADSAQLLALAPAGGNWVDIGTGAGFPGLVLAAMGARVTLIESIGKKVRFLQTVGAELGLDQDLTIIAGRAESVAPLHADVVTARAVAPMARLIPWGRRHLRVGGTLLFPKGRSWAHDIADARRFGLAFEAIPSNTDADARILRCRTSKASRCA